ncbi:tolloid-like protein 2 [Saccoglossus kowalevskii]
MTREALLACVFLAIWTSVKSQEGGLLYHFTGTHEHNDTGTFTSPNFPDRYPGGIYRVVYRIENSDGGHIQLLFHDFILTEYTPDHVQIRNGPNDTSELYGTYHGASRPPAIVSSSSELWVEFLSGSRDSDFAVGFKASYKFVADDVWEDKPEVIGEFYTSPSHLLFIKALDNEDANFDVIWSIKAPTSHKVWVRFQNLTLSYISTTPSLVARDGLTSTSRPIGNIGLVNGEYRILSTGNTMFIRLVATLKSRVDIVNGLYVHYVKTDPDYQCPPNYFPCQNDDKCINNTLVCDGVNHCGDGSDEAMIEQGGRCGKDGLECLCYNGGYCDQTLGICICPENFYGSQCQFYYTESDSYYMVLYVCGGLIGLVLTCMCSVALSKKHRRGRHMTAISATSTGQSDYRSWFRQFSTDTEHLADPELFYMDPPPPAYSLCFTEGFVAPTNTGRPAAISQPDVQTREEVPENGTPEEPPPAYEETTSAPMLQETREGASSASINNDPTIIENANESSA